MMKGKPKFLNEFVQDFWVGTGTNSMTEKQLVILSNAKKPYR